MTLRQSFPDNMMRTDFATVSNLDDPANWFSLWF
jgi:hypothetical protein